VLNVDSSLVLPDGFTAYVVAEDLGRGRHIAVNDNGDIYVSLRRLNEGGGIAALRDTNNDMRADIVKYFGKYPGTGIGIHKGYLYFGSDDEVMRYKLKPGELIPDLNAEIIATGFPDQNQHEVKPFAFDNEGFIYVNVGGPSNACMEQMRTKGSPGMDPCPQLERQAGVWRFKDDVPGQDQVKDGYRYSTGLRNSVALEWNDNSNYLYVVMHGRDQLNQFFPDMYTEKESAELPAEEFFLLEDGSDGGWPYCYYDQFQDKKILAPEYGGDRSITGRCKEKTDPIMAFPGHVAPNDLIFYSGNQYPDKYKNGAFIAFHGSWNRSPLEQEGFYVVFVPFEGAYPSGDWEVFADNFDGLEKVMSPGDALHRPCGLAQAPDGSIYVVDSREGKVWKIVYEG
ncbi:MAG: PQQ-dependent sugar dehydrogenase, partial [Bacteroidales bacterium]